MTYNYPTREITVNEKAAYGDDIVTDVLNSYETYPGKVDVEKFETELKNGRFEERVSEAVWEALELEEENSDVEDFIALVVGDVKGNDSEARFAWEDGIDFS